MLPSIRLYDHTFSIRNFNDHFVLLYDETATGLAVLGQAILNQQLPFIDEVIATEKEVYLKLNEKYRKGDLEQLKLVKSEKQEKSRLLKMPVYFAIEGDWGAVCTATGFSKTIYLQKLIRLEFSIAMFGFMPGFVYLNGLTKALQVPRKAKPSQYMPPNSLALGGPYLGVYSLPSPAGWHQIGTLPFSLLAWEQLPPLLLDASDRILLEPINEEEYHSIQNQQITFLDYNGLT